MGVLDILLLSFEYLQEWRLHAFLGSLSHWLARTALCSADDIKTRALKDNAIISVDRQVSWVSCRNKQAFVIVERPKETKCAIDTSS